MSRILRIPVAETCEQKDCSADPTVAYLVAADYGKDGVAVYCENHADEFADPRDTHTAIGEVD